MFKQTLVLATVLALTGATAHAEIYHCEIGGVPSLRTVELPEGDFQQEFDLGSAREDNGPDVSLHLVLIKRERRGRNGESVVAVRFSKIESGAGFYGTYPLGGTDTRNPQGVVRAWLNVGNALAAESGDYNLPEAKRFESAAKYRKRLTAWLGSRAETKIRSGLGEVVDVTCIPHSGE